MSAFENRRLKVYMSHEDNYLILHNAKNHSAFKFNLSGFLDDQDICLAENLFPEGIAPQLELPKEQCFAIHYDFIIDGYKQVECQGECQHDSQPWWSQRWREQEPATKYYALSRPCPNKEKFGCRQESTICIYDFS